MSVYTHKKISQHMTAIADPGNVMFFLIEGASGALVIDTGYGVLNPREYVESLTDRSYEVICTHAHGDHIMGMKHFDWAYLPSDDFEILEMGNYDKAFKDKFRVLPEKSFDLGGVSVVCLTLAGHTPGIVGILVEEDRVIMLGDACNTHTWMFLDKALPIAEFKQNLEDFKANHQHKFDQVFVSHNQLGKAHSPEILDECIEVCELILSGNDAKIPYTYNNFDGEKIKVAMPTDKNGNRDDGKAANIMYHVDRLR